MYDQHNNIYFFKHLELHTHNMPIQGCVDLETGSITIHEKTADTWYT